MVVDRSGDDELIRFGLGEDPFEAFKDRAHGSDVGAAEHVGDACPFLRRPVRLDVVNGWRQLPASAAEHVRERLLHGGEEMERRGIVVAAKTFTATIAYGCFSCADGWKRAR